MNAASRHETGSASSLVRRPAECSRASRLNEYLTAIFDTLADARDDLDDDAYTVFVDICTIRIGNECARLVVGEALRATRQVWADAA
jgi:hypothetical protein